MRFHGNTLRQTGPQGFLSPEGSWEVSAAWSWHGTLGRVWPLEVSARALVVCWMISEARRGVGQLQPLATEWKLGKLDEKGGQTLLSLGRVSQTTGLAISSHSGSSLFTTCATHDSPGWNSTAFPGFWVQEA